MCPVRVRTIVLDHADYLVRKNPQQDLGSDRSWMCVAHQYFQEYHGHKNVYRRVAIPYLKVRVYVIQDEGRNTCPPHDVRRPRLCRDYARFRQWLLLPSNHVGVPVFGEPQDHSVYIENFKLSPEHSQQVYNHSLDGFSWGCPPARHCPYGGSGSAQLALALMLLYCDCDTALRIYQDFKQEFVAKWHPHFVVAERSIIRWIERRLSSV